MSDDNEALLDAVMALLPPLLTTLDALGYAGRQLHPPHLGGLAASLAQFRPPLSSGLESFRDARWPEHLDGFRGQLECAAEEALAALDGLDRCVSETNPVLSAYRALRHNTRAVEALYPVTSMLPPVSRFFLTEDKRDDAAHAERLAGAEPGRDNVGILHVRNGPAERGGFSLYVPEYYAAGERYPLVVALHGGSGHGRSFLWSWLRDARSRGAIVAAPTSAEATWSLMGPDVDSANLDAIVARVCETWNVDPARILLTGMSDGGTFAYVSGLRSNAPFTHLAPISASFHPLLLDAVSGERLSGLPVYLVHGALDWMFAVDVARTARDALTAAGALVTYCELADLSHTYPVEQNAHILDWLMAPG